MPRSHQDSDLPSLGSARVGGGIRPCRQYLGGPIEKLRDRRLISVTGKLYPHSADTSIDPAGADLARSYHSLRGGGDGFLDVLLPDQHLGAAP